MMFPEMDNSDDYNTNTNTNNNNQYKQVQLKGPKKNIANSSSILTNYNPLTAMDSYENNTNDANSFIN